MKKCPYCAEEIQDGAIKCKHCGEWLSPPTANTSGNVTDVFQPGIKAKEAHSVLHRTAKDSQKSKGRKRCEDCDIEFSESEFSRNPYVCNTCVEKKLKTEPPKNMEENKLQGNPNLIGIRGWLWLLIVGFMIINPLVGFSRLYDAFYDYDGLNQLSHLANNPQWQMYEYVTWLIVAASAGISISAGYRLWKIHFRESVRFAIPALWLIGPLNNVLQYVSIFFIFDIFDMNDTFVNDAFAEKMIGSTIGSCIVAGIWTAYLKRSVRVKNTYTGHYIQANEVKL